MTADWPLSAVDIPGLHHVTAICSDPQRNLDFYVGLLGLRLVKKTVNFDDPGTYHLYYGDAAGTPGTILTFFAWISAPPFTPAQGRQGSGQITAPAFGIATGSLDFWIDRLSSHAIDFDGPHARFDEQFITFRDPDGLPLEIVAHADAPVASPPARSAVPADHALRGFHGVSLSLEGYERSAELLTSTMGFDAIGVAGNRFRFATGSRQARSRIDLVCEPDRAPGRMGIGVVHHVAWRARSDADQTEWRNALVAQGYDVTPVLDRKYFRSIYYREPGGIIFEIATDGPGFAVDEEDDRLGAELKLPDWLEPRRARIEAKLPGLRQPRPTR